jgi:hypothetical protein
MKIMGEFYKQVQILEKLPVDCSANNMFVYADTVQRTLGTAHALVEGMCGSRDALKVFHEAETSPIEPRPGKDARVTNPIPKPPIPKIRFSMRRIGSAGRIGLTPLRP